MTAHRELPVPYMTLCGRLHPRLRGGIPLLDHLVAKRAAGLVRIVDADHGEEQIAELDGRPVIISGSGDRTVRVWDLATGAPIGDPFAGHTGGIQAVAAAELDGRPVIISGSDDQTVRVWDLATGAPIGDPFAGHSGPVFSVAAAELDGRPVVVSGSDDQTVRVWDLATATPVKNPYINRPGPGQSVTFGSSDGRTPAAIAQTTGRQDDYRPGRKGSLKLDLGSDALAVTWAAQRALAVGTDIGIVILDLIRSPSA